MALPDDERRKARTVTATDTEWQRIGALARKAGLPVSRFVVQRLTEPVDGTAAGPGISSLVARDLRVLVKIEERRFLEEEASGAWDELVAEAEAEVDGEEAFG